MRAAPPYSVSKLKRWDKKKQEELTSSLPQRLTKQILALNIIYPEILVECFVVDCFLQGMFKKVSTVLILVYLPTSVICTRA